MSGGTPVHGKTHLFGNPHTFKYKHVNNGFGAAGANSLVQLFDITDATITRGGDIFLARADNDFYPRDGGAADGSCQMRVESLNAAASLAFTKGDLLADISVQYEGRSSAKDKVLTFYMEQGLITEDVVMNGRHGAQPGTLTFGIDAVIRTNIGGIGVGDHEGPYYMPWTAAVETDATRNDNWSPITPAAA